MGQSTPMRSRSYPVVVGTPKVIDMMPFGYPATVTACPGASGSLTLEYSTTPRAAGDPASAEWITWPGGTATSNTSDTLESPVTAIRATAATAAGTVEVIG